MKYFTWLYLSSWSLLISISLNAQDRIYYKKNKVEDWKVNEITPGYIKGNDINNPKISYSISQPDLLFVINNRGNFLVIPQLFESKMKAEIYINYYLHFNNDGFKKDDQIITRKNTVVSGNVLVSTENEIRYEADHKVLAIAKSDISLIIYKDGSHKLFAPIDKVYGSLKNIQDQYYQYTYSAKSPEKNADSLKTSIGKDSADKQSKLSGINKTDTSGKDVSNTTTSLKGTNTKAPNSVNNIKELDPQTLQSLQEKAITSIKELESFMKIVCSKKTDADQSQKAIAQAMLLFASEDSRVEVSSKNRTDAQQYKVRVYLNRLGILKYDKVFIEWYNIQYASKVRKNPDGTYSGFIEFEQRFTGISGDKKIYQDITRKTTEIAIRPYYKRSDGETSLQWDVFLGNIGISVNQPE